MGVKVYSMDDVGTRAEHLSDLHELWSFAYGQVTKEGWHNETEKEQAIKLSAALTMLMHHMQSEYKPTMYAQVINSLPADATLIPDDRMSRTPPRIT